MAEQGLNEKTQTKPFNYFATPNDIQCFSQDWNVLWPDKLLEPVSHPVDQCLLFSFTCPNPFSIGHFPLHRIDEQFCGLFFTHYLCPPLSQQTWTNGSGIQRKFSETVWMQVTLQSIKANRHPRRSSACVPGTMNTLPMFSYLALHNNPVRELASSLFPGKETQTQRV